MDKMIKIRHTVKMLKFMLFDIVIKSYYLVISRWQHPFLSSHSCLNWLDVLLFGMDGSYNFFIFLVECELTFQAGWLEKYVGV